MKKQHYLLHLGFLRVPAGHPPRLPPRGSRAPGHSPFPAGDAERGGGRKSGPEPGDRHPPSLRSRARQPLTQLAGGSSPAAASGAAARPPREREAHEGSRLRRRFRRAGEAEAPRAGGASAGRGGARASGPGSAAPSHWCAGGHVLLPPRAPGPSASPRGESPRAGESREPAGRAAGKGLLDGPAGAPSSLKHPLTTKSV